MAKLHGLPARVAAIAARMAQALLNGIDPGIEAANLRITQTYRRAQAQSEGREVKPARGGTFTGPQSGYRAIMHGTETVVAHSDPAKGLRDLVKLGFIGGASAASAPQLAMAAGPSEIHVHVHVPGGTTLIGTAREVGEVIAPHVARALGRQSSREARRR